SFCFQHTASIVLYCVSLHDALPIYFDSRLAGGIMFDTGAFNYLNSDSNYWQFIGRIPLKERCEDMEDVLYLLFETKKYLGQSGRSEEHTSELQSRENLVCRLLLEKK